MHQVHRLKTIIVKIYIIPLDSRFSEDVLPVLQVQNLILSNLEKLTSEQIENIKTEFKSDFLDFFNIDSEIER